MKVSKKEVPARNSCGRLLNSLRGSGITTILLPDFDDDSLVETAKNGRGRGRGGGPPLPAGGHGVHGRPRAGGVHPPGCHLQRRGGLRELRLAPWPARVLWGQGGGGEEGRGGRGGEGRVGGKCVGSEIFVYPVALCSSQVTSKKTSANQSPSPHK